MRIAITGSTGQLGRALMEVLREDEVMPLARPECDITWLDSLRDCFRNFKPEVVIHTAAFTNVDGCELEPERAYAVNALGTRNVAVAALECDAAMVYVSTNEVFDGTSSEPYWEFDRPNPVGVYGRSKLAGEQFVREILSRFFIVRTAWLYYHGGNNFVTKIIRAADERGSLRVVTDEVSNPTYALDLAEAISRLIRTKFYGTYHFTNSGYCSRYDFAKLILKLSGRENVPVEPITSKEWVRVAKPPLFTPLRNFAGAQVGITLRSWEEALKAFFDREPGLVKGHGG
ncbi:MAG: dTDP-4-dehydrorhamnose reductase [Anaerolineae bacterium]|nr:dTDP-4-dehydrorhamnose reductase [Anaerolineae bacterium]MDW8101335.1 dTDP-4-dehydrorhamnose reductase [Anaerolineae bacterium]